MLQIASFMLPEQQAEANEFLATHKPAEQGVNFTQNVLMVFFDDGNDSPAYQIAELREYLKSVKAARFQQEVSLFVAQNERDTINAKNNKGKYEELSHQISHTMDMMKAQDHKIAFLEGKIAELQ